VANKGMEADPSVRVWLLESFLLMKVVTMRLFCVVLGFHVTVAFSLFYGIINCLLIRGLSFYVLFVVVV